MNACEPSELAREWARLLFDVLAAATRRAEATDDAGRIYLEALHRYTILLLRDLGGFEDVIVGHGDASRLAAVDAAQTLKLHVLQEALKYADATDPALLMHVNDMYRFTMRMLRELGVYEGRSSRALLQT